MLLNKFMQCTYPAPTKALGGRLCPVAEMENSP